LNKPVLLHITEKDPRNTNARVTIRALLITIAVWEMIPITMMSSPYYVKSRVHPAPEEGSASIQMFEKL
jgi:hypothetical protein